MNTYLLFNFYLRSPISDQRIDVWSFRPGDRQLQGFAWQISWQVAVFSHQTWCTATALPFSVGSSVEDSVSNSPAQPCSYTHSYSRHLHSTSFLRPYLRHFPAASTKSSFTGGLSWGTFLHLDSISFHSVLSSLPSLLIRESIRSIGLCLGSLSVRQFPLSEQLPPDSSRTILWRKMDNWGASTLFCHLLALLH